VLDSFIGVSCIYFLFHLQGEHIENLEQMKTGKTEIYRFYIITDILIIGLSLYMFYLVYIFIC